MEQTKEQKILKFISSTELFLAVINIIFMAFLVVALVVAYQNNVYTIDAKRDLPNMIFSLVKMIVSILLLFLSYKALRTLSYDQTKHHKAWIITLVLLAFCLFNFITGLGDAAPRYLWVTVVEVIVNCIALFLIDRIRKQAKTIS